MKPEKSYFFYDLETSGFSPRNDKIMQFAGQRTDEEFNPIGSPVNTLIKLTSDTLPSPDAILVTGITPQKSIEEGITEAEFIKIFDEEILKPNTTFVGFNNIRFDDEFMRFLFFRNYHDAYGWQWENGCSRFDILDLSRATRALKPAGINWPYDKGGKPANKLELLSSENNLDHTNAHDALSDVLATIAVAKMIKINQPELYNHYYEIRGKKQVYEFIQNNPVFVYTSGKYSSENEKTAIVYNLNNGDKSEREILVYDLKVDPSEIVTLSPEELAEKWKYNPDEPEDKLPVKSLRFNRCPAIAPLSFLEKETMSRLKTNKQEIERHLSVLRANPEFKNNLLKATQILNKDRNQPEKTSDLNVDASLYNKFINDTDKKTQNEVLASDANQLEKIADRFNDDRLKQIMPLYKARNFPKFLNEEEKKSWHEYCKRRLTDGGDESRAEKFNARLSELFVKTDLDEDKKYLLEELNLYAQNILSEL